MRLPSRRNDVDKIHYLTDFYINKFELPTGPFNNSDNDALLKFYNYPAVTFTSKFSNTILCSYNSSI